MANHKQALKRHRQNLKRRARNRSVMTNLRGLAKVARSSFKEGPDDQMVAAATRAYDRAASKGVLHKRAASRRVSRLTRAANRARQGK